MIVVFRTKAYADITMFGDVAKKLLRMMGHSGTVPGAIRADDVPATLERLRAELARIAAEQGAADAGAVPDKDDEPPRVGIAQRAFPLVELLEAAAQKHADVMWR